MPTVFPTLEDVDRAVWLALTTPPIQAQGIGAVQVDNVKRASLRQSFLGDDGTRYWCWMSRTSQPASDVGASGEKWYEREDTIVDGKITDSIFHEYTAGTIIDIGYQIRYSVLDERTARDIKQALMTRLPQRGVWIAGPLGIKYQAFGTVPGFIDLRDDVISERMEVIVPHVLIGREPTGATVPGMKTISVEFEPTKIQPLGG